MPKSTGKLILNGQASSRCKCAACGEIFSTESNFDKHRVDINARKRNKPYETVCVDPETVGLAISETSGCWITPQDWRKDGAASETTKEELNGRR